MSRLADRFKVSTVAVAFATSALSASVLAAESEAPFTVAGPEVRHFISYSPGPLIARNDSGDFVVIYRQAEDNNNVIRARLYNADGTPKGASFAIGGQLENIGSVLMAPSGAFVISSYDQDRNGGVSNQAKIRRYAADGTLQGSPIVVGSFQYFLGAQFSVSASTPVLAMDADGDVVVGWSEYTSIRKYKNPILESSTTYAAVYRADGTVLRPTTVVDSTPMKVVGGATPSNSDWLAALRMDAAGNIAMFFVMNAGSYAGQPGVKLFDLNLGEKRSLQPLSGISSFSTAAMDAAGNFAIASVGASDSTLYVSRYAADATLLGVIGPFGTAASGEVPTLSMAPSGDFVVTWGLAVPSSAGNGFTTAEKHAQYFHADGSPNGSDFVIDGANLAYDDAISMAAAVDANGNLVSVWNTYNKNRSGTTFLSQSLIGRLTTAP